MYFAKLLEFCKTQNQPSFVSGFTGLSPTKTEALGVMPQMTMPSLTGGLTGLTGVAGVGTDPMAAGAQTRELRWDLEFGVWNLDRTSFDVN